MKRLKFVRKQVAKAKNSPKIVFYDRTRSVSQYLYALLLMSGDRFQSRLRSLINLWTKLLECNFHSLFNMSSIKIPYHLNTCSTHSLTHLLTHSLTHSHHSPHVPSHTHSLLQEEDRIMRKEALLLKEKMGSRDTTTVSGQYTHTHSHTHTLTHTHTYTHTHTHTLKTLTWHTSHKIVCNRPVYVDYGYRLGIFT